MGRNKRTEKFDCVMNMPPLYHTVPGEKFETLKSPVVKWLLSQPSIVQFVFDKAKEHLVYDPTTGTWQGVNYEN